MPDARLASHQAYSIGSLMPDLDRSDVVERVA